MCNQQNILIGALSEQCDCPIETIRYYERIELLPRPVRTGGGQRCYQPNEVQKLEFIVRARKLGFSISDIRDLMTLSDNPKSCADVEKLTKNHLSSINEKIAELQKLAGVLHEASEKCAKPDNPCCPVIAELSKRAV